MQPSATSRWIWRGPASPARQLVLWTVLFAVLAASRPCLAMSAESPAQPHCVKHGSSSPAPRKAPTQNTPELCCMATAPAIAPASDVVWNTASLTFQENIDPARKAFLAFAAVLVWPASCNPLHSILRI